MVRLSGRGGFVLSILISIIAGNVNAFNIDVNYPITFQGDHESYFGYSLAFLNASNDLWLIVGAPKANVSRFYKPGSIFKCKLDNLITGSRKCSVLSLDSAEERTSEMKNDSWLGVSVDATSFGRGAVLACRHRSITMGRDDYKNSGVCYSIGGDFREASIKRFSPNFYRETQFGISAQFVKNSGSIIVGSPEPYAYRTRWDENNYSGAMYLISQSRNFQMFPSEKSTFYSYFGYAITSGQFQANRNVQYAIGNPNQEADSTCVKCYHGKVFIVNNDNREINFGVELVGEQMGEYYGSSICAVDLNNDQLDDLLVGAPLHGIKGDEGKVYVYINLGQAIFRRSNAVMGSAIVKARFGTSIANIGDINKDGYPDVAIGAPYENDGAVYIYHGNEQGLSDYKQRITAAEVGKKVQGFGIAITGNLDVDGNNYEDIAIGAYQTDRVFLYRSRPVVKLQATLTPDIKQIDIESKTCSDSGEMYSCFALQACVTYQGISLPKFLTIKTFLDVDTFETYHKFKRVMVKVDNSKPQYNISKLLTNAKTSTCYDYTILILNSKSMDFLTEIGFKLSYGVVNEENSFCSNCPVTDPTDNNETTILIGFQKNCGKDQKCVADLKVQASFSNLENGRNLTIGSMSHLNLHINIYNDGEPAYNTRMTVTMPSWMKVDTPMCQYNNEEQLSNATLHCLLDNPLKPNHSRSLDFALNLQDLPPKIDTYVIKVAAASNSEEQNDNDNIVLLSLPVTVQADISVNGATSEDQFIYFDEKANENDDRSFTFVQKYEVINYGPSSLQQVKLEISFPSRSLVNSELKIIQVTAVDIPKESSDSVYLGVCNGDDLHATGPIATTSPPVDDVIPMNRHRRDVSADNSSTADNSANNNFILNCGSMICETIDCSLGPFNNGSHATVLVTFKLHIKMAKEILGTSSIAEIVSEAKAIINDFPFNVQPDVNKPDKSKSSTTVKLIYNKKLASWIIPTSIAIGILILIVIIAVLIKVGFFQRKTKSDMKALIDEKRSANDSASANDNFN